MKRTMIWALALTAMSLSVQAGLEKERKWEKTYAIDPNATLELKSSFGDIQLETWEKNEIAVVITFVVEGSKEADVMEALEKCQVEESGSRSVVRIATSTGDWGRKIEKMETNIVIKAPASIAFALKHRFGNASLPIMEGPLNLDIQHGDIRVEGMKNQNNKVDLAFGDGIFGQINVAQMDIQHSDVKIHTVRTLKLDQQFSDVRIREALEALFIDCQHGDVDVEEFKSSLKQLELEIQFGDFNMAVDEGASWKLEADLSFSDISLPSGVKKRKNEEQWTNNFSVQAFHGDASDVNIMIDAQHSDVNIRFY